MDLVALTKFLVESIVKDPDAITVKMFSEDENEIIIQVLVKDEDMGAVIGKSGTIANAIRTIVQASAYVNHLPKVKINIESY